MNETAATAAQFNWAALAPALAVALTAVLGVLVEALVPRAWRPTTQRVLAVAGVAVAIVLATVRWLDTLTPTKEVVNQVNVGQLDLSSVAYGSIAPGLVEDRFSQAASLILLVIGLLSVFLLADRTSARDGAIAAQAADRPGSAEEAQSLHLGWQTTEVYPLTLLSLSGMMLFANVNNLAALFVVLEIISLPLYVLSATARHRRLLSQEAALKYFILGAFASGFLLFGSALLYGVYGVLDYSLLAKGMTRWAQVGAPGLLVPVGVILIVVGLLFKIAAVPFHSWSPDVYQGAPTPVTAFMASGVKAAAFFALCRFAFTAGLYPLFSKAATSQVLYWSLWVIAIATMVVGTVGGVLQKDIKRMLAYSAISHAGFMLIAIIGAQAVSLTAIALYSLVYGLATIAAFGVVSLVRRNHNGVSAEANEIASYAGLGKTNPMLAAAMALALLSFAGIPLTAGFVGKFQLFVTAASGNTLWLVVAAVVCSAITAFYYVRVISNMFFHKPAQGVEVVVSDGFALVAIFAAVVGTIFLGVYPQPVMHWLSQVAVMLVP